LNKVEALMTASDVLEIIRLFMANHIEVIIDGGWGVDALLGEQTRPHSDLDIAMPHQHVPLARGLLEAMGFKDEPRPDTRECNFVLTDDRRRSVDFHTYIYNDIGNLIFGLPYPLESLGGSGMIAGQPVRCITPEWMVRFHTGYDFDEDDYRDVIALCQRFGIDMPAEYRQFEFTRRVGIDSGIDSRSSPRLEEDQG
jgi:lincosamide nucleotidyltransferase A/C/D/E